MKDVTDQVKSFSYTTLYIAIDIRLNHNSRSELRGIITKSTAILCQGHRIFFSFAGYLITVMMSIALP